MSRPEWLPNWKNVAEYPDPVTMISQQWAWEFLRRNAKYQADYKEIILFKETNDPDLNERAQEVINSLLRPIDFSNIGNIVSVVLESRLLPAMHKKKENYPWIPDVCWRLVAHYNLNLPVDPSRPFGAGIFIECDNLPVIETKALFVNPRSIPDIRKVTITIDLGGNLSDQLEYIQGFFEAHPKSSKRIRKTGYLDCLRLLDGKASEARSNSIAKVLGKKRSAYDKIATKAEELCNEGFFDLSKSKRIPGEGNRFIQGKTDGKMFFDFNASELSLRKAIQGGTRIFSGNTCIHIKPHNRPTP